MGGGEGEAPEAAGAGGGGGAGGAAAGAGATAAGGKGAAAGEGPAAEPALEEPKVDAEALAGLEAMGFGRHRAVRALHGSGGGGVEAAVAWLEGHQDEEGLDEPLLLPPEQPLSAEEAKAKAEELVARAKARREAEEARLENDREKMRVRMGREIQEAQRIEKEQAFARRAEERQREKEEEERARAKIRAKLEEDRRERRRKLGLPEEETEEELAARREREAAKAKEAAEKQASNPNRPAMRAVALQERLRACLVQVKKEHGEGSAACFQTLLKYAGNIAGAPAEEKFRRIKKTNAAFSQRVAAVGGDAFLRALGFEDDGDFLFLPGDSVDRAALQAAGAELSSAISNPFFGVL